MYRIFLTNFGWYIDAEYTDFDSALSKAKSVSFDCQITLNGETVASCGTISGLRFYDQVHQVAYYAKNRLFA